MLFFTSSSSSPSHFLTLTLSHSHSFSLSHSFNLSFNHSRHAEQLLFWSVCSKVTVYSRKLQCFFFDKTFHLWFFWDHISTLSTATAFSGKKWNWCSMLDSRHVDDNEVITEDDEAMKSLVVVVNVVINLPKTNQQIIIVLCWLLKHIKFRNMGQEPSFTGHLQWLYPQREYLVISTIA